MPLLFREQKNNTLVAHLRMFQLQIKHLQTAE